MSLGGITDYLRANNISIPQDSSSGTYLPYANQGPYEDIMARMRASGGRGGSGGVYGGGGTTGGAGTGGAMGGYDPNLYSRLAAARTAAAGSGVVEEILSRDRGSRGGLSAEQLAERNDPNAWANLSDAQQANFYANNPGMGSVLGKAVNLIGGTTLGSIQKKLMPDLYENTLLKMSGINPTATSEINTGNTAQDPMQRQQLARQLGLLATPVSDAAIPRQTFVSADPTADAADAAMRINARWLALPNQELAQLNAQRDADNTAFRKLIDAQQIKMDQESGYTEQKAEKERLAALDSYYTGSTDSGGFTPVAAPVVAAPAIATPVVAAPVTYSPDFGFSEFTGYGGGGGGGGGYTGGYQTSGEFRGMPSSFGGIGASAYAKGGPVSMNRLQGPNPAGPDDGYATLKSGEFVINDKAVKKYGIELMNAINSGKINKGKLRGLLEM
jgi:hypothetical protein